MNQRIIPKPAWVVAGVVLAAGLFCAAMAGIVTTHRREPVQLAIAFAGVALSGYSLLIGYVHGDAKRRGMRYVMWTWLAILVPNAMGIILYFILREPIPNFCTGCGTAVRPGLAYCPRCGTAMAPSCPRCHRVSQQGWTHCAYCGSPL